MYALGLDEAEDVIYFSDKEHTNGSIFDLRLSTYNNANGNLFMEHPIEKIVQRTPDETVSALAYDPLERNLYWTDSAHRKIHYASVDGINEAKTFLDLSQSKAKPHGLALDICRRKLYWTNAQFGNASVESIDLKTKERQVLVRYNLSLPLGIVVDQLSDRIYWVVDHQAHDFAVDSANLNGTDHTTIFNDINHSPLHLAVTPDAIYWTDTQNNAVWKYTKESATTKAKNFTEDATVYGIVAHSKYLTNWQNDEHCKPRLQEIMAHLNEASANVRNDPNALIPAADYCLHDAKHILYEPKRHKCVCKLGWTGERCESSACHNYCANGAICNIMPNGQPKCNCLRGYEGSRCQMDKCNGYCLNDGICRIAENDAPECECRGLFGGARCQHNSTEICALYCRLLQHEPDIYVPNGCHEICEDLAKDYDDRYTLPTYKHLETCKNTDTSVIIILASGVVLSLLLVLLIVHALRRVYKPARPRIKKTFVVRKEASRCADTPLTNRPQLAAEQCEITIENCCNMNICETPCFDPKLVKQSLSSCDAHLKEDRKLLINNMDEDLY